MKPKTRIYDTLLAEHLAKQRQMAFVSGPRQVGKTRLVKILMQLLLSSPVPREYARVAIHRTPLVQRNS
ncbi:MAG: hypothetical protein ACR2O5_05860, partial [Thiogranum sp.]